jgi:hypothetical protein
MSDINKYFSYDHDEGLELHDTLDKAKSRAEECFQLDRDNAGDGWHDEVSTICYGIVIGKVTEISRESAENKPYDEEVEYELGRLAESDEYPTPRIYMRCPACKNDTLTINEGHLLCTWHACPDPTMIDRSDYLTEKDKQNL